MSSSELLRSFRDLCIFSMSCKGIFCVVMHMNAYHFEGSRLKEKRRGSNDNLSQMYMIFGDALPTS